MASFEVGDKAGDVCRPVVGVSGRSLASIMEEVILFEAGGRRKAL
jgi:hypothetical protein